MKSASERGAFLSFGASVEMRSPEESLMRNDETVFVEHLLGSTLFVDSTSLLTEFNSPNVGVDGEMVQEFGVAILRFLKPGLLVDITTQD